MGDLVEQKKILKIIGAVFLIARVCIYKELQDAGLVLKVSLRTHDLIIHTQIDTEMYTDVCMCICFL